MPRGTQVEYTVKTGDTIQSIASKFNSTMDQIMALNDIEDANSINAGQLLIIPVNIATATPTPAPTNTPDLLVATGAPAITDTPGTN